MSNSNEQKSAGFDQSDDLIAELARIVADDAKRGTVADAVEERAQNVGQMEQPTAPSAPSEPAFEPSVAPEPISSPAPFSFSKVGEGVTPVSAQERSEPEAFAGLGAQADDLAQQAATAPETPFDFDFSANIEAGRDALPDVGLDKPLVEPTVETPVFDPIGTAPEPDMSDAFDPDGIAALIEGVEEIANGQQPPEPVFEPIPVAQAPTAAPVSDEPFGAEEKPYEYVPKSTPQSEDQFSVSPTVSEPAPTASAFEDEAALAEIESLIADTAEPEPAPQPQAAPADAAEAAIMAALAASVPTAAKTAPVTRAEPSPTVEPVQPTIKVAEPTMDGVAPRASDKIDFSASVDSTVGEPSTANAGFETEPVKKQQAGMMPIIAAVAAIVLLALVGGIGYWMFSGQGGEGNVPVVAAQNTNVKETPAVTAETNSGSSVFNALEGSAENTSDEQLVSRDQTNGASGGNVARVVTPTSSSNGLTNRKVKTVTVLADGTIVSGTEASAGAEQLPDDVRPNVPEATTETVAAPTDEITNVLNSIVAETNAAADAVTQTAETLATAALNDPTQILGTTTETPVAATELSPTPPARPAGLGTNQPLASAVLQNNTPTTTTAQPLSLIPSADVGTTAAATNTTTNVSAPFFVQLSSQRSVEAAQTTISSLQRQYASVLGNATMDISRVDLGDSGIYYRVRVPSSDLVAANTLCSNLKAVGGDCFVRNN